MKNFHTIKIPVLLFLLFWAIALTLWKINNNSFYLFNFGYIGTALGIGLGLYKLLPKHKKTLARKFTQILIGGYMLIFLGFIKQENMQIEGFFFHLFSGVLSGAFLHYLIAKIFGPFVFGRGFCGWACWTAMVIDLLPYNKNTPTIISKWEPAKYVHFIFSISVVIACVFLSKKFPNYCTHSELLWLIAGNVLYFFTAIILAILLKDNRAFCKYLCPINVIFQLNAKHSLIKITAKSGTECTQCKKCVQTCPMGISVYENIIDKGYVNTQNCILCLTCTTSCPENILVNKFMYIRKA